MYYYTSIYVVGEGMQQQRYCQLHETCLSKFLIFFTGEKKRVNTNRDRRSSKVSDLQYIIWISLHVFSPGVPCSNVDSSTLNTAYLLCVAAVFQRKQPTKSLEELAIIVEVLEEDLKASKPYSQSNTSESPDYSPEPNVQPWNSPEQLQHSHSMKFSQENKMPQQATNYCMSELKLSRSAHNHNTSVPPLNSQGRCINDESDNMMPSPDSYTVCLTPPATPVNIKCHLPKIRSSLAPSPPAMS